MMKRQIAYGSGDPFINDSENPFNRVDYHESLEGSTSPIQFKTEDYRRVCKLLAEKFKANEIGRVGSVFTNWRVYHLIQGGIVEQITSNRDCGEIVVLHEETKGLKKLLDILELPYRNPDFTRKLPPRTEAEAKKLDFIEG